MMKPSRPRRGLTLLETLVTAAVLILGIGVVASTVVSIVRLNRRNLAQAQAYTLAEWWLERVTRMGCSGPDTASACAAKASLASIRSTSSSRQPAFSRQRRAAGAGPMPMIAGSTPDEA